MDTILLAFIIATVYGLSIGIVRTISKATIDDAIDKQLPTLQSSDDIRRVIRAGHVLLTFLTLFAPFVSVCIVVSYHAKHRKVKA